VEIFVSELKVQRQNLCFTFDMVTGIWKCKEIYALNMEFLPFGDPAFNAV